MCLYTLTYHKLFQPLILHCVKCNSKVKLRYIGRLHSETMINLRFITFVPVEPV